jgi:hypothetical protein
MKKLFLYLFVLFLLFGLGLTQIAKAATCAPGLCCGTSIGCAPGVSQKSADDCPAETVCCYSASVSPLAQCNLAGVGHQICSGTCAATCRPGQTQTETDDCTAQTKFCCIGTATETPTPATDKTTGGGATSVDFDPNQLSAVGDIRVPALIGMVIQGALGIIGSIALLYFIYGSFTILYSQGDTAKVQKGRTTMSWAAIGLIAIFGSYIFVSYIISNVSDGATSGGGTPTSDNDVCGMGSLEGRSCIDESTGTDCIAGKCLNLPDEIKCCKSK